MIFYVDGAAKANGNINRSSGGFGVVCVNDNNRIEWTHAESYIHVTNNQMELAAILYVLKNYGVKKDTDWDNIPLVYSDSAYAVNTLTSWMFNWEKKGWLKSDNQVPENLDIIQEYYGLWQKGYRIDLRKIRGHAGYEWNELADKLAKGKKLPTDTNDILRFTNFVKEV